MTLSTAFSNIDAFFEQKLHIFLTKAYWTPDLVVVESLHRSNQRKGFKVLQKLHKMSKTLD